MLPATDTLDRLGRGARAIARRRMEAALLAGFTTAELAALDDLLVLDPAVQMSRFAWLRALPEAPSERNLLALMDDCALCAIVASIRAAGIAFIPTVGSSSYVKATSPRAGWRVTSIPAAGARSSRPSSSSWAAG
jgi:hypothetical protein